MTIFYSNGDVLSCREEVLGDIFECNYEEEYDPVEEICIDLEGRTEGAEERINEIRKVIDLGISDLRGDEVWVEVKPNMEAHLHAILGYIRPAREGATHHIYDFTLLKCLVDLGIKTCDFDVPWNGIHSFCRWAPPALDLYNAVQKYNEDYRKGGELIPYTNPRTTVFFLTPGEIRSLFIRWSYMVPTGFSAELSLGKNNERPNMPIGSTYLGVIQIPRSDLVIIKDLLGV